MKLTKQQKEVLRALKEVEIPSSNRELSVITGLDINIITPRMFELRKKELVSYVGRKYDSITNRTVRTWAVN